MQKGIANLVLLIGVILIGVLVYGTFHIEDIRRFELKFPKATSAPTQTVNPTISKPSPTPQDETANWQTYLNQEGGYSVKYPPDYIVETANISNNLPQTSVTIIPKNYTTLRKDQFLGGIGVDKQPAKLPLNIAVEDYLNKYYSDGCCNVVFKSAHMAKLGDVDVYQILTADDPVKPAIIYVELDRYLYVFTFQTGGGPRPSASQARNYQDYEKIISTFKAVSTSVSADEKARIDIWISRNSLNQYGDLQDTVYAGGTPLFDETTGEMMDRYEYIVKRHPGKPWNQ